MEVETADFLLEAIPTKLAYRLNTQANAAGVDTGHKHRLEAMLQEHTRRGERCRDERWCLWLQLFLCSMHQMAVPRSAYYSWVESEL